MTGIRKPFDSELHAKADPPSRRVVQHFIKERYGLDFWDNPNPKGHFDLVNNAGNKVEVEWRPFWKGGKFPELTVHIPERKRDNVLFERSTYFIVSLRRDWLAWARWDRLAPYFDSPVEVPNRYVEEKEYFYDIPVSVFHFFDLSDPDTFLRVKI